MLVLKGMLESTTESDFVILQKAMTDLKDTNFI